MKRKTLHTWLSCVALLLAALMVMTVLAGCKNPSENPTGTTADNGTSTAAPATTTGKTDGPDGPEKPEGPEFPEACDNHKGNFICENCGGRMTPNGFFTSMKTTDADEAINVLVENLSVTAKGDLIVIEKAELTLKLENNAPVGTGYMKGTVTNKGETKASKIEGMVTLKDGKIRVVANSDMNGIDENAEAYITLDMLYDEMSTSMAELVRSLMTKLPSFVNTQLIPALKAIVEAHPELEDICARIADLFLTVTKTDNGYTVALSFDRLLALNEKLGTAKVSEFYDSIFGAGAFAEMETYANGVLDKKVSEVLNDLKAQGIDVVALLEMVNTLLPADDKGNTVMSDVLKQLKDETFLATTVGSLLVKMNAEGPMTDEDAAKALTNLKTQIAQLFAGMKKVTVWEFIEDLMSKGGKNEPTGYEAPQVDGDGEGDAQEPSMSDMVKLVLEDYKDKIKISYTTDAYGKVLSASIEADDITVYDESGDNPVLMFAVKGKVQFVNKYTSTVDYSKCEEKTNANLKSLTDKADKIEEILKEDVKDFLKYKFDAATVGTCETNYDKTSGILTVQFSVITDDYNAYVPNPEDETRELMIVVSAINKVEMKINLKDIMMVTFNDDCKDLRRARVNYKTTCKNDVNVTYAKWGATDKPLSDAELEKYHEVLADACRGAYDECYDLSLLLNTTTGEYEKAKSTHDLVFDHKKNLDDGWVREYYKCSKCDYISWQDSKTSYT